MAIIKPGHTTLNMDDISEALSVAHHHVKKLDADKRIDNDMTKPVLDKYRNTVQKADDTDLVAGIEADTIAKSIDSKHRDTVNNAINFDGHPWGDVMSKAEGNNLMKRADDSIKNYGDDISSLRDELYQLKHELEKKGIVRTTQNHFGYNDIFRDGSKPYEYKMLGVPFADCPDYSTLRLPTTATADLDVGDFIAIAYKKEQKIDVRQIKEISADRETVILDESLGSTYDTTASNIEIYKSYGVSKNGNFYFARDVSVRMGDEKLWTGLDDDTSYRFSRSITTETSSYAYSFRIPENKLGYLTKFQIQARAIGSPTLSVCIIDEEDIGNFKNPDQAKKLYDSKDTTSAGKFKMHFFAKSAPVKLNPDKGQIVYNFDFWNDEIGGYPLLKRKDDATHRVRYVAIIYADFADADNYADLMFLQNMGTMSNSSVDLETNNTVYEYTKQLDAATAPALVTNDMINASDLYYGVVLREAIKQEYEPISRGLYTAKITAPSAEGVSRARLTLRIGREGGIWNAVVNEIGIYGGNTKNNNFTVECTPNGEIRSAVSIGMMNNIRKPMELRKNQADLSITPDLIIGTNITKGTASNTMIVPQDPVVINPNDMVYRNAFIVSVKGKKKEYDPINEKYTVTSTKKVYLKPVAIIPDGDKYRYDDYSDRIVFEGDFTDQSGIAEYFTELELQIYWEESSFSEVTNVNAKQIGKIHDLVFSVDRTVC